VALSSTDTAAGVRSTAVIFAIIENHSSVGAERNLFHSSLPHRANVSGQLVSVGRWLDYAVVLGTAGGEGLGGILLLMPVA